MTCKKIMFRAAPPESRDLYDDTQDYLVSYEEALCSFIRGVLDEESLEDTDMYDEV
jgi:hypothetical protein